VVRTTAESSVKNWPQHCSGISRSAPIVFLLDALVRYIIVLTFTQCINPNIFQPGRSVWSFLKQTEKILAIFAISAVSAVPCCPFDHRTTGLPTDLPTYRPTDQPTYLLASLPTDLPADLTPASFTIRPNPLTRVSKYAPERIYRGGYQERGTKV
jgi:hypothetical protein